MKTLFKLTLALAVVAVCGSTASAQKFGYINMAELVTLMPESDSASVKLQALQKELGDQLDAVQVEFNTKYQEYQKNQATYSEAVNQLKTERPAEPLSGIAASGFPAVPEDAGRSAHSDLRQGPESR